MNDAQGNPVSGQAVGFTATGTANTFSAPSATTNAAGTGLGDAVVVLGRPPLTATVTAAFASTSVATTMGFAPGAVAAGTSSLTASPNSLVADGNAASTLVVTANDAQGQRSAGPGGDADGGRHEQHAQPQQRDDHGRPAPSPRR